ncbi:MAG: BlaI/MecI/CopY family transcriptional regulator [Lachnospiraceae bacterium]|nr:BlaI/MecI/CopY family transcriptional regulator [Lachnospiraceae bacterium]MBP5254266.1 BlaI/MecI/CopY family transcriptional regulator [Lachnospiraceae bacterium]
MRGKNSTIGVMESKFADKVWEIAPVPSSVLVKWAQEELSWANTTTYTVLRRLCEKGLFKTEHATVSTLISRKDFYANECVKFIDANFEGSFSDFFDAYITKKELNEDDVEAVKEYLKDRGLI